jgi:hypothetical protein
LMLVANFVLARLFRRFLRLGQPLTS